MSDQKFRESVPITLFISAVSMVLAAFFIMIVIMINNHNATKTNQFYNRTNNCILASTTPATRTPESIEQCYNRVEETTGVKGDRYNKK